MNRPQGLIAVFASHRVASNLFMFLFILAGLWALRNLTTQMFPQFELDVISITVPWSGASAEDVERSIVIPIEKELKSISEIRKISSNSYAGTAMLLLDLEEGSDVGAILLKVKQTIEAVRNLPAEAERPIVQQVEGLQPIVNVLVTGSQSRQELAQLAYRFEAQLLARGIRKVAFVGLPKDEIAIQIPSSTLHQIRLSLNQVADLVQQNSIDMPAGTASRNEGSKEIRSLSQQRTVYGFEQMPLSTDNESRLLRLGDIATIERRARVNEPLVYWQGQPAIEMRLLRTQDEDTLKSAQIFHQWLDQVQPSLPAGVEVRVYNEQWQHLSERIHLLLSNGISGMVLVVLSLLLFLNVRVAFWVAIGVPVSFLATLAVLHLVGGSINMISLFGLIMALGIIVDDAIVVGEDTLTHLEQGESAAGAAIGGARRMLVPVLASSLTTIAAFLPLGLLGGTMGKLAIEIPQVIICVIIASLVECFLILPGHLRHSMKHYQRQKKHPFKQRFDERFDHFRNTVLRQAVERAINHRGTVLAAAFTAFLVALSLWYTGYVKFTFFPLIDGNQIRANFQFNPGSPPEQVEQFLRELELALQRTRDELQQEYGSDPVKESVSYQRRSFFSLVGREISPERGALLVDLKSGERVFSNEDFIQRWRSHVPVPAGLNRFTIEQQESGPPGKAIALRLTGVDAAQLKVASHYLQTVLQQYQGVNNIDDNLPLGKEQLIYEISAVGRTVGLDTRMVGQQLRAAFDGVVAQLFYSGEDEIEVRVTLPDAERDINQTLDQLPLFLPDGRSVPISDVVNFKSQRGFEQLSHTNGELSVIVSADINPRIANASEIYRSLFAEVLPELRRKMGVNVALEGRALDQQETIADMKAGLLLGVVLVYIILAWTFASYSWPLAVMIAIPLGITGSMFGHLVMGKELSLFSMMGLFAVSGIVVNDAIVLITVYGDLRAKGVAIHDAIVDAICSRFRAVILTSLTTVAGLLPILFETSLQAQFLIPMAVSIVFGLSYATLIILLVIPALLSYVEHWRHSVGFAFGRDMTQDPVG